VPATRQSPLDLPYVYDVILSDFGRAATLRLLQEVAEIERDIVRRLTGHDFYDEYRRIMFTCVADLGYIKSDTIRSYAAHGVPLDRDVLFGTGTTPIPPGAVERIADVLAGPIAGALKRGYQHIRVVVPCNTLAEADYELIRYLEKLLPDVPVTLYPETRSGPRVVIHSVPRVVLSHLLDDRRSTPINLMLIGTALARSAYRTTVEDMGASNIHVIDCRPDEQDVMDRLVAASIDGDRSEIASLVEHVERLMVHARQTEHGSLEVIQASTDLSIGVGTESLQVLARQLVLDAYRPALDRTALA
jgi:hypothetical protein